jgi:DNA-binding NtrC family response regulator
MGKIVLLIDDDNLPMKFYIKALEESGFTVKRFLGPDDVLDFMEKNAAEIGVVVLDIMMPPGKRYKDENTKEGLRTGVFLFKDIRRMYPNIPVIVLTNVKNPETLCEFPKDQLIQKMNCPPFTLVELVDKNIIGQ